MVASSCERRDGELRINGYRVSVWEDPLVPEMDGGAGLHHSVNILNATELYT